jgi:uncharacterized iron-regulated membrane protein
LFCTLFLFVICLTGLPLVFEDEIEAAFPGVGQPAVVPPGAPLANLDAIVATAKSRYPGQAIRFVFPDDDTPVVTVVLASSPDAPLTHAHNIVFDAHTGKILRDLTHPGETGVAPLMSALLQIHSQLFLGLLGELFLSLIGLSFLAAIVRHRPLCAIRAACALRHRETRRFQTIALARSAQCAWYRFNRLAVGCGLYGLA